MIEVLAAVATLVLLIFVVAASALMAVGAWALRRWVLAREEAIDDAPRPLTDEQLEGRMNELAEIAAAGNESMRDEWIEEKRAEGWEDEQIRQYLADRPLIELN